MRELPIQLDLSVARKELIERYTYLYYQIEDMCKTSDLCRCSWEGCRQKPTHLLDHCCVVLSIIAYNTEQLKDKISERNENRENLPCS
jgi:hypothetical protein